MVNEDVKGDWEYNTDMDRTEFDVKFAEMNARNAQDRSVKARDLALKRHLEEKGYDVKSYPRGQLVFNEPAPPSRPAPPWVRHALWFMFVCACAVVLGAIVNHLVV
jgi:hypothetical protein